MLDISVSTEIIANNDNALYIKACTRAENVKRKAPSKLSPLKSVQSVTLMESAVHMPCHVSQFLLLSLRKYIFLFNACFFFLSRLFDFRICFFVTDCIG